MIPKWSGLVRYLSAFLKKKRIKKSLKIEDVEARQEGGEGGRWGAGAASRGMCGERQMMKGGRDQRRKGSG